VVEAGFLVFTNDDSVLLSKIGIRPCISNGDQSTQISIPYIAMYILSTYHMVMVKCATKTLTVFFLHTNDASNFTASFSGRKLFRIHFSLLVLFFFTLLDFLAFIFGHIL
jgi:hypothetical protein